MRHGLNQTQRQEVGLTLKVDPRLVLSSQLLQMTSLDLEQALEVELVENPALERLEAPDAIEDSEVMRVVAPQEFQPSGDSWESKRSLSQDETTDWVDLVSSSPNLQDQLAADLLPRLPEPLRPLGQYVIGCLDSRGYLTSATEEIALDYGCSLEEVEAVVAQLHKCQPAGIGARDIRECLLLQLQGGNEVERKLARSIVRNYLEDFAARKTSRIAHRYRVIPALVEASFELLASLSPYPVDGFGASTGRNARTSAVTPDLIFSRTEQGWQVEVTGLEPTALGLNRFYCRRLEQLSHSTGAAEREERKHLLTYVGRAKSFIESLAQRRETMTRVGRYLVQHQAAFLSTGDYSFLRPMTRAKLADSIDVHESTVSRATSGKFVQLATGEIISFDLFFKGSLRVQKMIEEILQTENPGNPLSDERIAMLLAERGITIARRTVSKYRDRGKNLSSRKRRVA